MEVRLLFERSSLAKWGRKRSPRVPERLFIERSLRDMISAVMW